MRNRVQIPLAGEGRVQSTPVFFHFAVCENVHVLVSVRLEADRQGEVAPTRTYLREEKAGRESRFRCQLITPPPLSEGRGMAGTETVPPRGVLPHHLQCLLPGGHGRLPDTRGEQEDCPAIMLPTVSSSSFTQDTRRTFQVVVIKYKRDPIICL